MNGVITAEQAKQITGGRTPLVPVVYEEAVRALVACTELDEAKTWADKADALAAWAKIYRDDTVDRKAKQLKLHAYRRMGQIASELRPLKRKQSGSLPGPCSLMIENGLKKHESDAASRLARISEETFRSITQLPRVPSPIGAHARVLSARSETWKAFLQGSSMGFRGLCRRTDPREFALSLAPDEREAAREFIREIAEWLDEFDRHLK